MILYVECFESVQALLAERQGEFLGFGFHVSRIVRRNRA